MVEKIPYQLFYLNEVATYQFTKEIEKVSGFSVDDFTKPGFYLERIHRDDKDNYQQIILTLPLNILRKCQYRFKNIAQEFIWVQDVVEKIEKKNSNDYAISGYLIWGIKITEPNPLFISESEKILFNTTTNGILVLDAETYNIIEINRVALEMFECKNKSKFYSSVMGLINDNCVCDIKLLMENLSDAKRNKAKKLLINLKKISGESFPVEVQFNSVKFENRDYILAVMTDVSDILHAEKLAAYRFDLEKLVYDISSKFINVASFEVDEQINMSFKEVCEFLNAETIFIYLYRDIKREMELTHIWLKNSDDSIDDKYINIPYKDNDSLYNSLHENRVVKITSEVQNQKFKSETLNIISEFAHPVQLHIALIYQGNIIGFLGVGSQEELRVWNDDDIQLLQMLSEIYVLALQRKEAIKVLLEGERTYREIYDSTTDAIMVIDNKNHSILDVNRAFTEIFGYSPDDYSEISVMDINSNISGFTQNDFSKLIDEASELASDHEWYAKNKNGDLFWTELSIKKAEIHGADCVMCVIRDISERKKSEALLRHSEDRFRSIVQQLSDIVFILDSFSMIKYVTPTIKNIMGVASEELLNTSFRKLLAHGSIPVFDDFFARLIAGEMKAKVEDVQMVNSNDENVFVELFGNNMLQQPSIKGVVITCSDITDRRNTEMKILEAVIRTEEHERERFAKNLHDDLGPLLSSLKMYITMLSDLEAGEKRDFVYKQVETIMKEAIITTKNVSNDLSPHVLTNYGLASAIETFIKTVTNQVNIHFENDITEVRFPSNIESSVYRITKELINNSLKHSEAKDINIKIREKGAELILKYKDNGTSFSMETLQEYMKKGMGLSNIISRSKTLNSTYNFFVPKSGGFGFEMRVPLI